LTCFFAGFFAGFFADFLAVELVFFLAAMVVSRVSEGQNDERFLGSGRLAALAKSQRTRPQNTQMSRTGGPPRVQPPRRALSEALSLSHR
jgi:hypothetical protein